MRVAIDTNVLVRFLVRDDERQARLVFERLKEAEEQRKRFSIPLLVMLETIWVLEKCYDRSRTEVLAALQSIRNMAVFEFEGEAAVWGLLRDGSKAKADLSDVLIAYVSESAGCEYGITFDKKAAKLPFFHLLK